MPYLMVQLQAGELFCCAGRYNKACKLSLK